MGSIDAARMDGYAGFRFSALRRAVLGSIADGRSDGDFCCGVSVLSDEPCWGQSKPRSAGRPTRSVSVLSDEPCWGQCRPGRERCRLGRWFQCSPTSRVGVNRSAAAKHPRFSKRFSALRRAVLGSINQFQPQPFACPQFQCSPTSRVGVNTGPAASSGCSASVSVLSDEPCWGQLGGVGRVY